MWSSEPPSTFLSQSESLNNARDILDWLVAHVEGDQIEEVTDEMLDKLVAGKQPGLDPLFCK